MTGCSQPHETRGLWCAATEPPATVNRIDDRRVLVAIYSVRVASCGLEANSDPLLHALDKEILSRGDDTGTPLDIANVHRYAEQALRINGHPVNSINAG